MRHGAVRAILAGWWLGWAAATSAASLSVFDGPEMEPAPPPPSATNLWFDVGEEIFYNIYWGFIHVGSSHVTTDWVRDDDGRTLLRIRFESRSNKVLATLYPVEDLQEALIDPETFLTVQTRKKSRQGRHYYDEVARFDRAAGKVYWKSLLKDKQKEIPIAPDTRDLIALMYLIRSMDYKVGDEMNLQVYTEEKVYDLVLKIPRKETVRLSRYNKVASLVFDPEAAFQGLFVRKGKVTAWVSNDQRKLLTKLTATVPVASVRIQIEETRGPGEDFWVGKRPQSQPLPVR